MRAAIKAKARSPRVFSLVPSRMYIMVIIVIFVAFPFSIFVNTILKAHPEVLMVANSQCANPIQNWNGKIMGIPVWKNALERAPSHHNIKYRGDFSSKFLEETKQLHANLRGLKMTMDTT